jgi:small subunit ribosomal protein S6
VQPDPVLDSGRLTFLLGVDVVVSRAFPQEGAPTAVRRYELMLVFRPDAPDERISAIIDRTTRQITAAGGQIVKVAPWGRRRLAYAIDRHREGAYHIVVFESPTEAIAELERDLQITEEVLRHLTVRQDRPARAMRDADDADEGDDESLLPSAEDEEEEDDGRERIDESESEAAPAAID